MSTTLALTLLKEVLNSICKENSDWSVLGFEPMALVLTLCELLHECELLWDTVAVNEELEPSSVEESGVELGTRKIQVKELVIDCMTILCHIMKDAEDGMTDAGMLVHLFLLLVSD